MLGDNNISRKLRVRFDIVGHQYGNIEVLGDNNISRRLRAHFDVVGHQYGNIEVFSGDSVSDTKNSDVEFSQLREGFVSCVCSC